MRSGEDRGASALGVENCAGAYKHRVAERFPNLLDRGKRPVIGESELHRAHARIRERRAECDGLIEILQPDDRYGLTRCETLVVG
ncbi:MAG: hypothetical protein WKH64_10825 [Chloroflexia bacterium]